MAINLKERELAAVGISVGAGCKPCTSYHVREARKAEATDEQIREAVADAVLVRRNATQIMENHGLARLGAAEEIGEPDLQAGTRRIKELVSIGAAFAVNCTSGLARHLEAGKGAGVTEAEVEAIIELATMIKARAAHHAERLVPKHEASGVD